jgi:glycosyltransferase involved in cell wall biosynthesis
MKILVLSHVSDYVGGAERSILDVLDEWKLKQTNIEVFFILRKPLGSYVVKMKEKGYMYESVDFTYWSDSNLPNTKERKYTHTLRNTRAIKKIRSIINDFKPDFVLTNSIVAPWAAIAAYQAGVPHVWFAREYGDLDHGREFEIGRKETWEDIDSLSAVVLANSESLSSHIGKYVNSNKILTVYNPFNIKDIIEISRRDSASPFFSDDSTKLILTSGGISPSKGQKEAIEAVAILFKAGYNVELALVGRPGTKEFMDELTQLIAFNKLKKQVHFTGYTSNPLSIAAHADIGLMASRMEAFGRVTFEYQAIGLPVVGANSGATPEIIEDTVSGFLYKPGNSKDLAEKIEYYLLDNTKTAEHKLNAMKRAETLMTRHTSLKALDKILKATRNFNPQPNIHYINQFINYPEIAQSYFTSNTNLSVYSIIVARVKNYLRPYYKNLRSVYAKITGK